MIFHCPACRELAKAEQVVIDDKAARAGVVCPACGEVAWLTLGDASSSSSSSSSPSSSPLSSSESESASSSGPGSAPSTSPAAVSADPDPVLLEAVSLEPASPVEEPIVKDLVTLTARWHDFAAHRALIRRAQVVDALPALGVRYRRVLQARPGDEVARKAQQEMITLAMASLSTMSAAADTADSAARRRLIALALSGAFLIGMLVLLAYLMARL